MDKIICIQRIITARFRIFIGCPVQEDFELSWIILDYDGRKFDCIQLDEKINFYSLRLSENMTPWQSRIILANLSNAMKSQAQLFGFNSPLGTPATSCSDTSDELTTARKLVRHGSPTATPPSSPSRSFYTCLYTYIDSRKGTTLSQKS